MRVQRGFEALGVAGIKHLRNSPQPRIGRRVKDLLVALNALFPDVGEQLAEQFGRARKGKL